MAIEKIRFGDNEEDKRVFLWREQGIGDDIIFLGLGS